MPATAAHRHTRIPAPPSSWQPHGHRPKGCKATARNDRSSAPVSGAAASRSPARYWTRKHRSRAAFPSQPDCRSDSEADVSIFLPRPRSLTHNFGKRLQGSAAPTTPESAHQRHVPQDDVNRLNRLSIRQAALQQNYELDSLFVAANPVNRAKRTRWISMWVENGKRRAKMRAFFNELTYQPSDSQRIDARGKPRHLPGNRILVQHAL